MEMKKDEPLDRWFYRTILERNGTIEVRAIRHKGEGPPESGYYSDLTALENAVKSLDESGKFKGIYFSLHKPQPGLDLPLNQPPSRATMQLSAAQIEKYRWILLDFDPERPTNQNSTEAEREEAEFIMGEVWGFLTEHGFPEPIMVMSGNGYQLLFPFDAPKTAEKTVRQFLRLLDRMFSTDKVKVDTKVYDLARIARLPGTVNRKGPDTPDRPQRVAEVLALPDEPQEPITEEKLIEVVGNLEDDLGEAEQGDPLPAPDRPAKASKIDVRAYCEKAGLTISRIKRETDGSVIYSLGASPFPDGADYAENECGFIERPDGVVLYQDFHSRGDGRTFKDVCRELDCRPDEWESKPARGRFDFGFRKMLEVMANNDPPKWLIKGVLEADSLGCVFGAPESYKSFLALKLAYSVVTAQPFFDHETKTPGPVLYFAGEGARG